MKFAASLLLALFALFSVVLAIPMDHKKHEHTHEKLETELAQIQDLPSRRHHTPKHAGKKLETETIREEPELMVECPRCKGHSCHHH